MGVVGVVANTWLPRLVAALRGRYPGVSLRIDMSLTRALIERLRGGRLDAAIIAGELTEPGFRTEPLGHDEFAWMASPKLRIPGKVLGPEDLRRWPILGLSEDSFHYPVIERWFRDAGTFHRSAASCKHESAAHAAHHQRKAKEDRRPSEALHQQVAEHRAHVAEHVLRLDVDHQPGGRIGRARNRHVERRVGGGIGRAGAADEHAGRKRRQPAQEAGERAGAAGFGAGVL